MAIGSYLKKSHSGGKTSCRNPFSRRCSKVVVRVVGRTVYLPGIQYLDSFFFQKRVPVTLLWKNALPRIKRNGFFVMLKYMLDTNIAIYVIKCRPVELLAVSNRYAGKCVLAR